MNYYLIGGDLRQVYLAGLLEADGHRVHTYLLGPDGDDKDLSAAGEAHVVIFPLPAVKGEFINAPLVETPPTLDAVLDALRPGQLILAGKVTPELAQMAGERGLTLIDYYDREELTLRNAVATSEGAIQLAMEALPITLHSARVLILGVGRIGRVLAGQLRGLGARVTLAARKPADLALVEILGCEPARSDRLAQVPLETFDLVLNTVPAPLLDRTALSRLRPETVVIDLASAPGGTDFAAAEALGVRAIFAPGLPGKAAPATAARAIQTTLYTLLTEIGA